MADGYTFLGYFILWILAGFIQLLAAIKLEGISSEEVERSDKLLTLTVLVWPVLTFGLIVYGIRKSIQWVKE